MNIIKQSILAVAVATTAPLALGQDQGFYAGAGLGRAEASGACNNLGGIPFSGSCDDRDTTWKILGGYQFNRNFSAELGYTELGKHSFSGTAGGAPASGSFRSDAFELVGVGTLPLNEKFGLYGKAGLYRWDADGSTVVNGVSTSASDNGTDLTFGLGLKYNFTRSIAGGLEWQRYNNLGDQTTTGERDIDTVNLGMQYRF